MFSVIKRFKGQDAHSRMMYLADYTSDVENLPTNENRGKQGENDLSVNAKCSVGSLCSVVEDGSVWILNNQNEWIQQSGSSSSYTGSEATSAEVLALFGWSEEE
ncbi:MAG: hypothetical protein LUD81_01215 [Clostridiales bacterium]|nr:hypothetical protein [Clostridiales bacterium]